MTETSTPVEPTATEASRRGAWIVGTDGSTGALHAADWAARNAAGRTARLVMTSVWSVPAVPMVAVMGAGPPTFDIDEIRRSSSTIVDDRVAHVRDLLDDAGADVDVVGEVMEGATASVLLDASRDAALLVLGSRGHGGFSRLVLGSTSTQCTTHSIRPTAVVPLEAPAVEANRIVVAVDGSANSLAALRWAQEFAREDSVIDVVTVRSLSPGVLGIDHVGGPPDRATVQRWFDGVVDRAEQDEAERRGSGAAPELVRHLVDGDPRTELALVAETGDLLVIGGRGHGAIGTAILGSVATWLLHHVQRPIVVVPSAEG